MYASNVVRSLRDQSFARTLRIAGTSQRYYGLQALHKDTTDCRHFAKILRIAGTSQRYYGLQALHKDTTDCRQCLFENPSDARSDFSKIL
jgi:hypothetical protein